MRLAVGGTRKVGLTPYILAAMLQVSRTLSKSDSHAFIHLLHPTEGSEAVLGLGNAGYGWYIGLLQSWFVVCRFV